MSATTHTAAHPAHPDQLHHEVGSTLCVAQGCEPHTPPWTPDEVLCTLNTPPARKSSIRQQRNAAVQQ